MTKFQIDNMTSGADLGIWEAESATEAHAAMITEAGYDVTVVDDEIVFADAEAERIHGDMSDIVVTEIDDVDYSAITATILATADGLVEARILIGSTAIGCVTLAPRLYDGVLDIWGDGRDAWADDGISTFLSDQDDLNGAILEIVSAVQMAVAQ